MPRFEGVHQPFKPKKPYWLKKPKTEAQRKHFARMAAAVQAHMPAVRATVPNSHHLGQPLDSDEYDVNADFLNHLDNQYLDLGLGPQVPGFIDDIERARVEDERQERALALQRATQEMFYAYIECHLHTTEWGDPNQWDLDRKPQCTCQGHQLRVRHLDLVDILCTFSCVISHLTFAIATSSNRNHDADVVVIHFLDRKKLEVKFCGCHQNDNTRLIYMGYIGGSPKYPETAFSIRLLRFFHTTWKYCTSRVEPWTRGLDEYLDAFNPLLLTKNEQDKLAENCPRCFGTPVPSTVEGEPDIVVCLDGNFQHRRHIAAGTKAAKIPTVMPDNFLPEAQVTQMEHRLAGMPEEEASACAEQHTAANDRRAKGHWAGCDETGLMAMVCRHDHPIRFANIVQSGEKQVPDSES
ncbi:uncharacterized protein MELLADRAFT_86516 [Melampsora larici-populina 98AG31]|uniref:CxC1-like cysteine cluster associated with KDZ transposases domain-containing protein n=1 Tax=Melampsora larici-populina (strain 98AG31 / pathotype 3-4-7) TaxID=747676 RepID=F4SDP9_MELLP|nr:uncharacterized protein MELLADRAFT_86516 [Melampsora larici-populina 98AG31]EGF97228.1 hypothetical protein MELLADRAFT_86516 [Melampsora larici-populina 98AG31]